METIEFITKNNLCFGCGICGIVCPNNCINFYITNAGRIYPKIKADFCKKCSTCYNICPGYDSNNFVVKENPIEKLYGEILSAYIGRSLDEKIYRNSQSGGMVTQTLTYLFEKNLIRYALVVKMEYSKNPFPKYFFAESPEELYGAQKSIYAPVELFTILKNIENKEGEIAIVGLPCHIEGVVSLINCKPEIYNKIKYKLGLICDGNLSFLANKFLSQFTKDEHKIIYRNKAIPNYIDACITLELKNGKKILFDKKIRLILKKILTLPRC